MNSIKLTRFFAAHELDAEPLVLATVIDTGGSTYSKAGDFMLIDGGGQYCGMLSGGCLEGDLVERAQAVLLSGSPQLAEYDLSPDDEIWGLGVGCDGTLRIFLQPILSRDSYEPYRSIVNTLGGTQARAIRLSGEHEIAVRPNPALLVLGAGPDVEPILYNALLLGWRCTVSDHRPAYVSQIEFAKEIETHCCPADAFSASIEMDTYDLALVMSHHLVSDSSYVSQLAESRVGYIGLLGPARRRDRILESMGPTAEALGKRLRAPVGLDLGGRGAGAIAVSIIAEMQDYLTHQRRASGEL